MFSSEPAPVWEPTDEASTEFERDLKMALERLTSRARQLDEAVDGLMGEVSALLATRKRLKRLEQQERERRRGLEDLRDVLTAAVENLEETLS